jgi:hypothetical protein
MIVSLLSGTRIKPISVAVMNFLPTGEHGTMFGEAAVLLFL